MIKANEFRIGNWVIGSRNKYSSIKTIRERSVTLNMDYNMIYSKLFPIPLTPEILEKAGFKKLWHINKHEYTLRIDDSLYLYCSFNPDPVFFVSISQDNYDENINLGVFVSERQLPIKYLHQLQNIYFALTGEELIINL